MKQYKILTPIGTIMMPANSNETASVVAYLLGDGHYHVMNDYNCPQFKMPVFTNRDEPFSNWFQRTFGYSLKHYTKKHRNEIVKSLSLLAPQASPCPNMERILYEAEKYRKNIAKNH